MKNCHLLFWLLSSYWLHAQDYRQHFDEGMALHGEGRYYDAYLKFNEASAISEKEGAPAFSVTGREWADRAALGLHQQYLQTDSLLRGPKTFSDAILFFDNGLTLAHNGSGFGYINRQGAVVIDHRYAEATLFDEETGYAKAVDIHGNTFWLSPTGKTYLYTVDADSLPKLAKAGKRQTGGGPAGSKRTLSAYRPSGTRDYHALLDSGIGLYGRGSYHDAYLHFNDVASLAKTARDTATAAVGMQLRDSAIVALAELTGRTGRVLERLQKIRDAFHFYDGKFAVAYTENGFRFIDRQGKDTGLGAWDKAMPFDARGLAKVSRAGQHFLLDTTGAAYPLARSLEGLGPGTTALELDAEGLSIFPEAVFQHTQLKVLTLTGLEMEGAHTFFDGLYALKELKWLNLGDNQLDSLPGGIGQLKGLTWLDVGNNKLTSLPDGVVGLANLVWLDLGSNRLGSLPDGITGLANLEYLNLGGNQLTSLPEDIGRLSKLAYLGLYVNQLTSLPESIGDLDKLTELEVPYNDLVSLPESIGKLRDVTRLVLTDNRPTTLPQSIGQLQDLAELDLWGFEPFDLGCLCEALANVAKTVVVTTVAWESNEDPGTLLVKIPPDTKIPACMGDLKGLAELNLGDPEAVDAAQHDMEGLFAALSRSDKPVFINAYPEGQEGALRVRLAIQENLPENIGQIRNLAQLDLKGSNLVSLPGSIGELGQLTFLNLHFNDLASLPESIGKLGGLQTLILKSNRLTTLPESIGQLGNLTVLDLAYNNLTSLPKSIRNLKKLVSLDLRDNPLGKKEQRKIKALLPNCEIAF